MENFNEVQDDFENFYNLDYVERLALIDKYQIECLITNVNLEEKRLDRHFLCSNDLYFKVLSSNFSNFNFYNFSPQNEKEQLQLISWLIKRQSFSFKPFDVIKNEFLEEYTKSIDKNYAFEKYFAFYDIEKRGEVLFSINKIDNHVYRKFYDFGANDYKLGNNLDGLIELLFDLRDGVIYAEKGTLNISKIVEYCCFYFQGIADANLLYYLQNEKENLGKVIAPATKQRGFDLGLTKEQLKVLYKELIENDILDKSVECDNFIIVFRDEVLNDYKPLKWKNKTKGAVFVSYYFGDEINYWSNYQHLFEPADYKQLLYNSKNAKTFDSTIDILQRIDFTIKNIDRVGGK